MLADPNRQTEVPLHRVRLRGARIDGSLDLTGADISGEVWIDASRIDGELDLFGSYWTRNLSLEGSLVTGDVDLGDAKIGGQFNLKRAYS